MDDAVLICTAAGFNTDKMQMYSEKKRRKVQCDTFTCIVFSCGTLFCLCVIL